ncbi:MAG: FAD-dependent monooxygenase, partial [Polyangiaceae bacterium]
VCSSDLASVRVVEQKVEREPWSKAAGIWPRTLEIFADMGIVEAFLEQGRKITGVNMFVAEERLVHFDLHVPRTRFPFLLGQTQAVTEQILQSHLASLGVEIERGVALEGLLQDGKGVTAQLKHEDGQIESCEASWLVGCDGARSTTRHLLGLDFEGDTFEAKLVQADVHIDFPFKAPDAEACMFLSPNGPMGCLPFFGNGRYRLIVIDPPDHDDLDLDFFRRMVDERGPAGMKLSDPDWMASFRFHGRIAAKFRMDRVFLAGDSAHIHSPVGAQGMNMGIQDAYNLGWKLAAVHRGGANDGLLDSYELERRPVAQGVVAATDLATKIGFRMLSLKGAITNALRNQAMQLVFNTGYFTEALGARAGGTTISYADSPAVGEYHSSLTQARLGSRRAHESATVSSWRHFNKAPGAGDYPGHLDLSTDGYQDLPAVLAGTKHVLLLFDGLASTPEGYENLLRIAGDVNEKHADEITVYIVTPQSEVPQELGDCDTTVLLDSEQELHSFFGSQSESLYVIRPDGHIGFRSQPAHQDHLRDYLTQIFG